MRFDFIVCGGGTAGCVLANRLSEDGATVLLLEAGYPDNHEAIHTPLRAIELWRSQYDWGYETAPQTHCHDRKIYWPRGKMLGGGSSMNGMIYVRGHASDYDHWAYLGNPGWDFESLLPYFKKSEDYDKEANEYHAKGGLLHVNTTYQPSAVMRALIDAVVEAGYTFNEDCNGEDAEGASFTPLNVRNGKRQSTATAFLRPALSRPNLTVLTGARTASILFEADKAVGVRFFKDGEYQDVVAEKEVILAAGTLESPKILMLSGIGHHTELEEAGIQLRKHLPGVGKNLHDHTMCGVIFEGLVPLPFPEDTGIQPLHGQMFLRSQPDLPAPDMQPLFFQVPFYTPEQEPVTTNGFTLHAAGVRPSSRGALRVTGPGLDDPLHIDPNLLATDYDVDVLVQGIRVMRDIAAQPAMAGFTGREIYPGAGKQSDAELADYARSAVTSYHHQVGTCKMGVDEMAVVDARLRVHGLKGLRVVDASIMPAVPSGNTNAPVVMIAEKAADMIKADWS